MMSIWHLVWIVPLAGSGGFLLAALMAAAAREDEQMQRDPPAGGDLIRPSGTFPNGEGLSGSGKRKEAHDD